MSFILPPLPSTFSAALLLLAPLLAQAVDGDNALSWAGCGITKRAFMQELATAYEARAGVHIDLQGGGATRGIRDTANLKIDLGGSCRMPLPQTDNVELHAVMHPVAWDALALIVHQGNRVDNLTTEQVKKIYTGKVTNWSQVGGDDAPIHLFVRESKISGVGYALRQYLFSNGEQEFVTRREYVVASSGPLEQAVVKDPFAIGITGVSSARKLDVKILNFDGRTPSYDNVKNGSYGLYRPLYLVTSPTPSAQVKSFVEFATSKEGRDVLRRNGTVPYAEALNLMSKMQIYGFGVE